MAVASKIVLRNSDISGESGADVFEIDPAEILRVAAKTVAKITLDVTPDEGADISDELAAFAERVRQDLDETFGYLYEIHASLTAAGQSTVKGKGVKADTTGLDTEAVRKWARENGLNVADRGRLSVTIVNAYRAAHGAKVTNLSDEPAGSWDESDQDPFTVDEDAAAEAYALATANTVSWDVETA